MDHLRFKCRLPAPARALLALCWLSAALLAAVGPSPRAQAESVTQGFAKAQRMVEGGNAKAAVPMLKGLLKRYPDHEPSRMLLAHVYYQLGLVAKALHQYRRLPTSVVTPDIAYEYGISFFTGKDCTRAVLGFNKVPPRSKEANLAAFYLGICALNAYECQKAAAILSKAKDLPPSLESVRKKALAKAVSPSCQAQPPAAVAGSSAGAAPYPPPAYYGFPASDPGPQPPLATAPGAASPATAAAGPPPANFGFTRFIEPNLYLKQRNKTANYFGFKNGNSQTLNEDIGLRGNFGYYLPPMAPGGQQAYAYVEVFTEQNWGQTSGTSETYVTQSSQPGAIYSQASTVPPGATHLFLVSVEGKGGYPLRPTFGLFAGDKITEGVPEVDFAKSTLYNEIYGGGQLGDAALMTTLKLSLITATMSKLPPAGPVSLAYGDDWVFNSFSGSQLSLNLDTLRSWDSYSVQGKFNYASNQPGVGYYMSGENSRSRVEVVATESAKIGVKFTLSASYQISSQYNVAVPDPSGAKGAPSVKATAAQANSYSVAGQADIKPLDWCFGMVSYRYTNFSFSGLNPVYATAFQQASTQIATTFTVQIGLDKKF